MKEKERIAAVRQRAHDEVQTLRNKIEQTQDKINAFDEERGSESELKKTIKTILKTILNGLKKSFMICNSNKKRNPKKKSISKEELLLPKKRKDSTARNHSTTLENRNPSLKH